jgi:hypothetical protein
MDLLGYVEELRRQLLVAAETGGDEARAVAERLTAPLEASVRLVLLDALTTAASEITLDLAPGSVDVRLRGRDPEFVVTLPPGDQQLDDVDARHASAGTGTAAPTGPPTPAPADGDEGGTARLTLRLPEHLKARIEHAAGQQGISVNSWLTRVAADALDRPTDHRPPARTAISGQRFTGWAR